MTTASISTPATVTPAASGRVRSFLRDTVGFLPEAARLLWRHWPVLFAFALGGTLARELLIEFTPRFTAWGGGLGYLLLFPLLPTAMLTAMVLMLRVVRPSLRYLGARNRPEPMVRYLASVLIPFFTFYYTAGYADYDKSRYNYSIFVGDQAHGHNGHYLQVTGGLLVLGVAVLSWGLRWVLVRFEVVRRVPVLALPVLYIEVLWLYSAFIAGTDYTPRAFNWLKGSKVWYAGEQWWRATFSGDGASAHALAGVRYLLDQFFNSAFPVLLAPIAALVAGSVVLAARITPKARARRLSGGETALRVGAEVGRAFAGRFGLLGDSLRRVFQAGVVPMMVFCVVYACQRAVGPLLNEPERLIFGAREPLTFWEVFDFTFLWFNGAIALAVLMCLIAAFVDGTAARIARRSGPAAVEPGPTPVDVEPDAAVAVPAMASAVGPQPTMAPPSQSTPLPTRVPSTPPPVQGQPGPATQGLWQPHREPDVPGL